MKKNIRKKLSKFLSFVIVSTQLSLPQNLVFAQEVLNSNISEEASEIVSEEIVEETSETVSEEIVEETSETVSEEIVEETSEIVSEEIAEETSEIVSEENTEEISQVILQQTVDSKLKEKYNLTADQQNSINFFKYNDSGDTIIGYASVDNNAPRDIFIPADNNGTPIIGIADGAFDSKEITSVTFANDSKIQTIGSKAFAGNYIEQIDFPKTVTQIGTGALSQCKNLQTVVLPEGITSLPDSLFEGCSSLVNVNIPSTVKTVGSKLFLDCSSLEQVVLPEGLEEISDHMFYQCSNLTTVNIPSTVKTIGVHSFSTRSNSLKTITLPEGLEVIKYAAFYTSGISEFNLPSRVTKIEEHAFYDKIVRIDKPKDSIAGSPWGDKKVYWNDFVEIGDFIYHINNDTNEVEIIEYIGKSKEVTVPEKLDYQNKEYPIVSIGANAFRAKGLTKVVIPGSIKTIKDYAFYGNSTLTDVTLNEGLETIGLRAFHSCPMTKTKLQMPSTIKSIGNYAFYRSNHIHFPKHKYNSIKGAPWGAKAVTWSDTIETKEGLIFHKDTETILGYIGQSDIVDISEIISDGTGDYDVKHIGNQAFMNSNVTEVTLPTYLETIGVEAFREARSLQSIEIPGSVKDIKSSTFQSCISLKEVTLNEGLQTIGSHAFYNTPIKSIKIPSSVTIIGARAFSGIYEGNIKIAPLKEVIFDLDNSKINYIADYAFANTSIEKIKLPKSLGLSNNNGKSLSLVFDTCPNLQEIYVDIERSSTNLDSQTGFPPGVLIFKGEVIDSVSNIERDVNNPNQFKITVTYGKKDNLLLIYAYEKSDGTRVNLAQPSSIVIIEETITLTDEQLKASSQEIPKYTYTAYTNISGKGEVPYKAEVKVGNYLTYEFPEGLKGDITKYEDGAGATIISEEPTKEGFEFLGWATEKDASQPEYGYKDKLNSQITMTGNIILYPVWAKKTTPQEKEVTINYHLNGGNIPGLSATNDVATETVKFGSNHSLKIPTKGTEHTFKGWYLEGSFNTKVENIWDVVKDDSKNTLDLYARWDKKQTPVEPQPPTETPTQLSTEATTQGNTGDNTTEATTQAPNRPSTEATTQGNTRDNTTETTTQGNTGDNTTEGTTNDNQTIPPIIDGGNGGNNGGNVDTNVEENINIQAPDNIYTFGNLQTITPEDENVARQVIGNIEPDNQAININLDNVIEDSSDNGSKINEKRQIEKPAFGFGGEGGYSLLIVLLVLLIILVTGYIVKKQIFDREKDEIDEEEDEVNSLKV